MTRRPLSVPPEDLELLRAIDRTGSVAGAARSLGMPRDRAVYRIERLRGELGGPVLVARRGGAGHGTSRLSAAARRWLASVAPALVLRRARRGPRSVLVGRYRSGPDPFVEVRGRPVYVDFVAREGERVGVAVDPEAIVVASARFPTSARNVWDGVVLSVRPVRDGPGRRLVQVRALGARLAAAVTPASSARLGLAAGRRVVLYAKATALRRAPLTPGSPRS